VLKLSTDVAEFCRSGDGERDPSADLLRERASEYVVAVFRHLPDRGGSGDWVCRRKFCAFGDEERSRDPSGDLLRDRASEYVFAVFRPLLFRGVSDDCKRSCVMVKPAQISRHASVELEAQAKARSGPD